MKVQVLFRSAISGIGPTGPWARRVLNRDIDNLETRNGGALWVLVSHCDVSGLPPWIAEDP